MAKLPSGNRFNPIFTTIEIIGIPILEQFLRIALKGKLEKTGTALKVISICKKIAAAFPEDDIDESED